mgnify:CR=1 FL=1
MLQRGIATFTLDYGKCPAWLFRRMVKLGREMVEIIIEECGPDEFVKRIADPVWFQSLGTVLAFDWNASGLTTILTAALKEAIRGEEKDSGIFICGGKGKTSLKTPNEIVQRGEILSLPEPKVNKLVYSSKMAAKVDSSLVQDGFQIYHHSFFFSKNGTWTVVQQGMNTINQTARRYHWLGKLERKDDNFSFVLEPHSGIVSQIKSPTLNLTAQKSKKNQEISTQLAQGNYQSLLRDIKIIRKHSSELSRMISLKFKNQSATFLQLANREFYWHPVLLEDFSKSNYLEKILWKTCQIKPVNYEKLVSLKGVGPKTIRALSLVSEVIYGAEPSYQDPARYSFAHGGKDGTPYFIDRQVYDQTIDFFRKVVNKMKISPYEKNRIVRRILPTDRKFN